MFQPVSLFIGSRYSKSQQRTGFVSFITFFSIAGILLGVAALIIVVSVMNGFEGELKKRILGVVPHVVINATKQQVNDKQWLDVDKISQQISSFDKIQSIAPYLETEALLQSNTQLSGVVVQGIFPEHAKTQALVASHMTAGSIESLVAGEYRLIIGAMLARKLDVRFGDQVRIMLPTVTINSPMGRVPVQRTFTISGIFNVGSQIDEQLIMIHGSDAAKLLRRSGSGIDKIRLFLDDAFAADHIGQTLSSLPALSDLSISTWRQSQGKLFEAVKMEKNMMWIMLSLIVAVAAFNIVSALVMVVIEKQSEIGILKTLGMQRFDILKVFITQGLINGLWGTLLGALVGVVITLNINTMLASLGLNIMGQGYDSHLPTEVVWSQVAIIIISALVMSFVATLYPAYRASNTQPAEVLRND